MSVKVALFLSTKYRMAGGMEAHWSEKRESGALGVNPWLAVWTRPRATIRAIVDHDPKRYVVGLIVLSAFFGTLDQASARNAGDQFGTAGVFIFAALMPLVAIPVWYVGSAYGRWAGGLFGGRASSEEVRAAAAWANVPMIEYSCLMWPFLLALFGADMFMSRTPGMDATPAALLLTLATGGLVVKVWTAVIQLKAFAEVHGFSSWKALGVGIFMMVPFIVLSVALIGLALWVRAIRS